MASSRPTRHPGCTTTGRVPRRVRTQQATTSAPIRTRLAAPRRSAGQGPWPVSGRCDADRRQLEEGTQVGGEPGSPRVVGSGGVDKQNIG
jgi:hypothetical protein